MAGLPGLHRYCITYSINNTLITKSFSVTHLVKPPWLSGKIPPSAKLKHYNEKRLSKFLKKQAKNMSNNKAFLILSLVNKDSQQDIFLLRAKTHLFLCQ